MSSVIVFPARPLPLDLQDLLADINPREPRKLQTRSWVCLASTVFCLPETEWPRSTPKANLGSSLVKTARRWGAQTCQRPWWMPPWM
jgi:hypothetical protein